MIAFIFSVLIISFLRFHTAIPTTPLTTKWIVTKWITLDGLGLTTDNLPQNWSSKTSHELLLKELSKKKGGELFYIIRGEFYTMSLGDEFYHLYDSEAINEDHHAIVNATINMWLKLSTMGKVEPIIKDSIAKAVQFVEEKEQIVGAMNVLFDNIEQSMKNDPTLCDEYLRIKNESKNNDVAHHHEIYYYEIPKTEVEAMKHIAKALNNPLTKRNMLHAVFYNQTEKSSSFDLKTHILVKSIVELSKLPIKGDTVQRLYEETISEVVEHLEYGNSRHPQPNTKTAASILLKKLKEKLEKNAELNSELETTKKAIALTIFNN
ncbi:hypothetical protein PGB90_006746 [Kerria lacca]